MAIAHAAVHVQIVQIVSHNFSRPLGSAIVLLYKRKLAIHAFIEHCTHVDKIVDDDCLCPSLYSGWAPLSI
eukprot:4360729-Amphidinium_carterae.1